jgi:hypothetical protein
LTLTTLTTSTPARKQAALDAGNSLAKGKRREHSCGPAVGRFQFRFLVLKIEFFDDYGLTSQLRLFGNPRSRIADDGSGLLVCFAIDGLVAVRFQGVPETASCYQSRGALSPQPDRP